MNDTSFAKLNATEATCAAKRKIAAIETQRERFVNGKINKRIGRNLVRNEKWWWWPWPRPVTADGVTKELANEDPFGLPFWPEKRYALTEEGLCRDVIDLADASCDGFVWLSPSHVRAIFCKV